MGARHQRTFTVTDDDLASTLYPDLCKPPVLASARALQWAELVAMTALGGCAVGAGFELAHVAPADPGTAVVVTAWCVAAQERRSRWAVELIKPGGRLLAYGHLSFVLIDLQRWLDRQPSAPASDIRDLAS